jgi:hypothetical protein
VGKLNYSFSFLPLVTLLMSATSLSHMAQTPRGASSVQLGWLTADHLRPALRTLPAPTADTGRGEPPHRPHPATKRRWLNDSHHRLGFFPIPQLLCIFSDLGLDLSVSLTDPSLANNLSVTPETHLLGSLEGWGAGAGQGHTQVLVPSAGVGYRVRGEPIESAPASRGLRVSVTMSPCSH